VESLNDGSTHRVTVESLGVNVESNWTHVPQGYKHELEMIKKLIDTTTKHEADVKEKEATQGEYLINWGATEKHAADHARIENSALKANLTKQKHLIEDLKDLVDMFATGNVDLRFYKRVIKDYLNSIEKN
jgi:hypothetical protein